MRASCLSLVSQEGTNAGSELRQKPQRSNLSSLHQCLSLDAQPVPQNIQSSVQKIQKTSSRFVLLLFTSADAFFQLWNYLINEHSINALQIFQIKKAFSYKSKLFYAMTKNQVITFVFLLGVSEVGNAYFKRCFHLLFQATCAFHLPVSSCELQEHLENNTALKMHWKTYKT